jgi:hypothetical protein
VVADQVLAIRSDHHIPLRSRRWFEALGGIMEPLDKGTEPAQFARCEQVTIYPNRTVRGYVVCLKTKAPCERIVCLMKKPVTVVLDWLWDRFTHVVMNQGRTRSSSGHP